MVIISRFQYLRYVRFRKQKFRNTRAKKYFRRLRTVALDSRVLKIHRELKSYLIRIQNTIWTILYGTYPEIAQKVIEEDLSHVRTCMWSWGYEYSIFLNPWYVQGLNSRVDEGYFSPRSIRKTYSQGLPYEICVFSSWILESRILTWKNHKKTVVFL